MAQKSNQRDSRRSLFVGMMGLFHVTQQASFATIRTLDVVQLVASGACFGAGFTALVPKLREPRP